MAYSIYGTPLRRGHCEVHPNEPHEYPCRQCDEEQGKWQAYEEERAIQVDIDRMIQAEIDREIEAQQEHDNGNQ